MSILSPLVIVAVSLLLQASLGAVACSPWVVPDLVVIALVLIGSRAPTPSWLSRIVAACLAIAVVGREDGMVGLAYGGVAIASHVLSDRLDLAGAWRRVMVVGIAEAFILMLMLARLGGGALSLIGWSGLRLVVTMGVVVLGERWWARREDRRLWSR